MNVAKRGFVFFLLLSMLLSAILVSGVAFASFAIDRQSVEYSAAGGEQISGYVTIINTSEEPVTVQVRPVEVTMALDGSEAEVEVQNELTLHSLVPYISLSQTLLTLPPRSQQRVEYFLALPEAVERSLWAALYFDEVVEPIDIESIPTIEGQVQFVFDYAVGYRTMILISPFGADSMRAGRLVGLKRLAGEQLRFEVTFSNTSPVYYRAQGWVEIRDTSGNPVTRASIDRFFVFPGHSRTRTVEFADPQLAPGQYLALAVVDYGGQQLVAGQLSFQIE